MLPCLALSIKRIELRLVCLVSELCDWVGYLCSCCLRHGTPVRQCYVVTPIISVTSKHRHDIVESDIKHHSLTQRKWSPSLYNTTSYDYSRCYIRLVACILQSIKCECIYSRNLDEIAIKKFLRNDLIHELIIVSLSCQDVEYSNPYGNFALKFRRTRPCLEKSILK